ncbi:MAG: sulfurtransferase [Aquaticitalea sp.]
MKFDSSIVSAEWLNANLTYEHLVVLDASVAKVGSSIKKNISELQIPKSRFFDLKNKFSKQNAPFPNTVPSAEQFQREAQNLGINQSSQIIIYDDLGIYSSPRAWWLFKLMGFNNVAVLNGGLPAWKKSNFPLETRSKMNIQPGDFTSNFQTNMLIEFNTIHLNSETFEFKIIDARSRQRFEGIELEPRKGLRSGAIPNSINFPYSEVIESTSLLNASSLHALFNNFVKPDEPLVFTCGSGITACILALAADVAGLNNFSVYDGSWTEYGSLTKT